MRNTLLLVIAVFMLAVGMCFAQTDGMAPPAGMDQPGSMGGMSGGMGPMGGPGMGTCPMCSMPGGCPMCPRGQGPAGGPAGGAQMWQNLVRVLELTAEQQQRLMNIYLDFAKTHITTNSQIQVAQIELFQMIMQDNVDRQRVEQRVRDIGRMQTDQQIAMVRALFQAKEVLTPEQWQRLRSMLPGMLTGGQPGGMGGMGMGGMHGGMGGGMPGATGGGMGH